MWVGIFTLHIHYCTNRGIINVTAMGKELPYSWLTARRMFSRTLKYISRYTTDILCLHIPPPHILIGEKSVFPWFFESLKRPIYGHSRNSLLYYSLYLR